MADDDRPRPDDDKESGSDKPQDDQAPEPPKPRWPWFLAGAVVLVFVVVVLLLLFWPRSDARTDDAYVSVRYASIAPQVSGQVAAVHVADNEAVRAGQLLLGAAAAARAFAFFSLAFGLAALPPPSGALLA